ncbi:MAG: hypothetical protein RIQ31_966 [Actinomycetota bacterium]
MRSSTKTALGLVSLGLFVGSYQVGLAAETGFGAAAPATNTATSETPAATEPSSSESPSASASSSSSPSSSTSNSATKTPAPTKPTASATPAPVATKTPAASQTVSKQSAAVSYKYGTVQVTITKSGNTITAVNLDRGTATEGRQAVFPNLIQATIDANGSGFGNISQATFTTDAFKQAVNSALAKF